MNKEQVKFLTKSIENDFEVLLKKKYNITTEFIEECRLTEDYKLTQTVVLLTITADEKITMYQAGEMIKKAVDDFYVEYLIDYDRCQELSSLVNKSIDMGFDTIFIPVEVNNRKRTPVSCRIII